MPRDTPSAGFITAQGAPPCELLNIPLPGLMSRSSAGAAVGLGAAAVGGATLAGRSVAVKGADAGRGAMHVVSQARP
jgi:hypothetical protein